MARKMFVLFLVVIQSFLFSVLTLDIPDKGVVDSRGKALGTALEKFLKQASGIEQLKQKYNTHPNIKYETIKGKTLADELAAKLRIVLERKMAALKKAADYAEDIASKYHYRIDYVYDPEKKEDYYEDARTAVTDNTSVFNYEFSPHFKKEVSYDTSNVHIPVEIYEGDMEILNGLNWTAKLDKIWRDCREEYPELLWQYFGSQSGILRTYPASPWPNQDVDLYDVRRRPWYTEGASSPKDVLILVDTSGSTHGQALNLMKQAAISLLDTLGENDFVNVAHFAEKAEIVGCFDTFVQATYRHKQRLKTAIGEMTAKAMANYALGFDFAFSLFEKFNKTGEENSTGEGAQCNRVIMFLTDGGTDTPVEIFKKWNWPEKKIRIFTYAVGPTANPIAAIKSIACSNRGYFYRIPAMGAIRSTVQEYYSIIGKGMLGEDPVKENKWTKSYSDIWDYVSILARPKAMVSDKQYSWTNVKLDMGLGMMTTVTLPVYNKTGNVSSQSILGVMGVDVTIDELERHIPKRKLGPNGYAFAINSNGLLVFHPDLKAPYGWLEEPVNVDFLEVEYEDEAKIQLRQNMIDHLDGEVTITTYVNVNDVKHADIKPRRYYYTPVLENTFSIGIVLPEYADQFLDAEQLNLDLDEMVSNLMNQDSALLIAPWTYCENVTSLHNDSTRLDDLLYKLQEGYDGCDTHLLQHLLLDANITEALETYWKEEETKTYLFPAHVGSSIESKLSARDGVESTFVGTNGGLTRVYPASAREAFEGMTDTWKETYYRRAFDDDTIFLFSADYQYQNASEDENSTDVVLITATKSVSLDNKYRPAVVGVQLTLDKMKAFLLGTAVDCKNSKLICYLVDDGGFITVSTEDDAEKHVGKFLGDKDIEPLLMKRLWNMSVFDRKETYDYQAACLEKRPLAQSAGPRSVWVPSLVLFDILNVNWWTAKFAWLYMNFNLYEWLFSKPTDYAYGYVEEAELKNYSCIKRSAQYTFGIKSRKDFFRCGNCTRLFAATRVHKTNLLLIMVQKDCPWIDCKKEPIIQAPVEVPDPNLEPKENCTVIERYRKRPSCYDYNVDEDGSDCGLGNTMKPSLISLTLGMLAVLALSRCYS